MATPPPNSASSLSNHLRSFVEVSVWKRSVQKCRLYNSSFQPDTFDGIRAIVEQIALQKPDPTLYKKLFSHTMGFLQSKFDDKHHSQNSSYPNLSLSQIQPSSKKTSSYQAQSSARKVVNITNNYYYGSKSQNEPKADLLSDGLSTTSGKSRRARRRIFVLDQIIPTDPIDVVIFPTVCLNKRCVVCSSWFITSVRKCNLATCNRQLNHIADRHVPNLNCADRRILRRAHATSDPADSEVPDKQEIVEKFATSVLANTKKRRLSAMDDDSNSHSVSWADQSEQCDDNIPLDFAILTPVMESVSELSLGPQEQ